MDQLADDMVGVAIRILMHNNPGIYSGTVSTISNDALTCIISTRSYNIRVYMLHCICLPISDTNQ